MQYSNDVLLFFQVLEVKASERSGSANYMSCIKSILAEHYGNKPVALGGTFLVEKSKVKTHVMVGRLRI